MLAEEAAEAGIRRACKHAPYGWSPAFRHLASEKITEIDRLKPGLQPVVGEFDETLLRWV
jgi:hypothetical protein